MEPIFKDQEVLQTFQESTGPNFKGQSHYHLSTIHCKINYMSICVLPLCISVIYTLLYYCSGDVLGYIQSNPVITTSVYTTPRL
jgi:hypothetical protein